MAMASCFLPSFAQRKGIAVVDIAAFGKQQRIELKYFQRKFQISGQIRFHEVKPEPVHFQFIQIIMRTIIFKLIEFTDRVI